VPDPVQTRLGVGEASIDHAAGMPLRARRSVPPAAPGFDAHAPATSARILHTQAQFEQPHSFGSRTFVYDDDPVELPLRSRTKSYVLVGAVVLALLVALGSVLLGGRNTMSSGAGSEAAESSAPISAGR